MMDGLTATQADLPSTPDAVRIGVLPGSRSDASENAAAAARRLAKIAAIVQRRGRNVQAYVSLAPTVALRDLLAGLRRGGIVAAPTGAESGVVALGAGSGQIATTLSAAVVLGKDRGFHVRLDGPPGRRVAQGAVVEGISEEQARARLRAADKARTAYVRRLYRADPADPALYHLVIDSTAVPLEVVIEIVLTAARAHAGLAVGATARS